MTPLDDCEILTPHEGHTSLVNIPVLLIAARFSNRRPIFICSEIDIDAEYKRNVSQTTSMFLNGAWCMVHFLNQRTVVQLS